MNVPEHTARPSLLKRCVENVSTVLGVWHPSFRNRMIHVGIGDVIVPALILILVQTVDYRVLQPHAELNLQVVQSAVGGVALALLVSTILMALMRQGAETWQVTVALLWAFIFGTILSTAALFVSDATGLVDWMIRRFGAVYLFALVFLIFRLHWRGGLVFAGLILPVTLVALPWLQTVNAPATETENTFFDPDVEMIYATQDGLLSAQKNALRQGVVGAPELFAVLGAGYPFDRSFRREVEAVGAILAERFEAKDRIIFLVNDDQDVTTYPLMNRVNLAASLKAVARAMNPEDIALIFLTSFGAPEVLFTSFNEVITRDLSPEDVDTALTEAGISNAILILPACHSGSFATRLKAPNRLILTGAASEEVSFDCNDQNEWSDRWSTFFVDAISETRDLRKAARLATESVTLRQEAKGLPPSSPQIFEGAAIGRILDAWQAELD